MADLRALVRAESDEILACHSPGLQKRIVAFGLARDVDRQLVWYMLRALKSIYRGRWSRKFPEVAPKLDAARTALQELSDAMWKAGR